jgi:signal transduction histidine kinase
MGEEIVRILMIEDNPDDALIARKLLEKCSRPERTFSIEHAENLKSGLALSKTNPYQLILTDLMLPDSQGIETFISVREANPRVPVVICSSLDGQSLTLEAIRKGAQDYIIKGQVDARTLDRVIHYALERRQFQEIREKIFGMIVHDLRNPLTVIDMCLHNMISGLFGQITEEQREFLTLSSQSSNQLIQMINNIMEMTKIELGKVELKKERVDILAIVRPICEGFRLLAKNKNLEFQTNFPARPIELDLDKSKISQVFMNLIGNAIKFTAKGSVTVSITDEKDRVECLVKDTGRGISEKYQENLFTEFQKMNHQGTAGEQGTGLGLAISKGIVDAHRGQIHVESVEGQGTIFTFTLIKS